MKGEKDMYRMSNVVYRLANSEVVRTLREAEKTGLSFIKEYEPINEEFPINEEAKAKRLAKLGF